MKSQALPTVLLAFAISISCEPRGTGQAARIDIRLPEPVVVVSLESELLAGPSGMAIDSAGTLWIADFQAKRLLAVNQDGTGSLVIGREGAGPGEFRGPLGLVALPDRIRVADAFNNRFQDYSLDGVHLEDHAPAVSALGTAAMGEDGRYVVALYGDSLAVAELRHLDDTASVAFGRPVVETAVHRAAAAQIADLRADIVPREMRNHVFPAIGADAMYLLFMADGVIQQYDLRGNRNWSTTLDVPEIRQFRDAFFALGDTLQAPPSVLMTVTQGAEVNGMFWVLLNSTAGDLTTFYVLDKTTGEIAGRVQAEVPGSALKFAIDSQRERLFLTVPGEAAVHRADLSSVSELIR